MYSLTIGSDGSYTGAYAYDTWANQSWVVAEYDKSCGQVVRAFKSHSYTDVHGWGWQLVLQHNVVYRVLLAAGNACYRDCNSWV